MIELLGYVADVSLLLMGLVLFLLLFGAKEIGYYFGHRVHRRIVRPERDQDGSHETLRTSVGFITGSKLAMLAFLLAIALSIADQRYEERRGVVLAEANAIGTAWLRAGVQQGEAGIVMQRLLQEYAEVRVRAVEAQANTNEQAQVRARTAALQNELWAIASPIARDTPTPISAQLLASLNEVFDLSLSQRRAFEARIPAHVNRIVLWASLLALAALGFNLGLLGGRQLTLSTLLILMWVGTMVLISDIHRAGEGLVGASAKPLVWTLEQMRSSTR